MIKRVCQECGSIWYSSTTNKEIWICEKCGVEIPRSQEKPING